MLIWFYKVFFKKFLFGRIIGADQISEEKRARIAEKSLFVTKELVEAGVRGATDKEFSDIVLKFKKEF